MIGYIHIIIFNAFASSKYLSIIILRTIPAIAFSINEYIPITKAALPISDPITSEIQEVAVLSTIEMPIVYIAIKGKANSLLNPT
jgi:hypothetical protein